MMSLHSVGEDGLRENFPKTEHILKTKEFREIYKNSRSFRRDPFVFYCRPNGLSRRRIGFSISSRNIKLATRRNKIRRMFKEIYRKSRLRLAAGIDIVIIARRDPGKEFGYEDYRKAFDLAAKFLGIMS